VIAPRTKPVVAADAEEASSSAIFGAAKPVNTAAKEREIEERLAREREALAAQKERERQAKEAADAAAAEQNNEPGSEQHGAEQLPPKEIIIKHHSGGERSHKTSFTSDDGKNSSNRSENECKI
jgi:translation initiation factor 4B